MSITAIEALKAEILAECGAVDPTIMMIIDRGRWRMHLRPEPTCAHREPETDDAARDAPYDRHMRMYAETEAVQRVLECFTQREGVPHGRSVLLDLSRQVAAEDIEIALRHEVIMQHTSKRWGPQSAWSITNKGIEMIRGYSSVQLESETAEERRRREVSKLTSHSYDDLRAKLSSMSPEQAAAQLGVSIPLIEEWRGRLGIFEQGSRS